MVICMYVNTHEKWGGIPVSEFIADWQVNKYVYVSYLFIKWFSDGTNYFDQLIN